MKDIRSAIILCVTLTLLCGAVYPMAVIGVAELLFPHKAHGSLVTDAKGTVVGSELLAQPFTGDAWFWPRPSATAVFANNPLASGGSNLGPSNPAYVEQVAERLPTLQAGGLTLPPAAPAQASSAPADAAKAAQAQAEKTPAAQTPALGTALPRVPSSMAQASGSGLDPHITPQAARLQIPRIAAARSLTPEVLERLVDAHTEDYTWGFLGTPRINVLRLNLALKGLTP